MSNYFDLLFWLKHTVPVIIDAPVLKQFLHTTWVRTTENVTDRQTDRQTADGIAISRVIKNETCISTANRSFLNSDQDSVNGSYPD